MHEQRRGRQPIVAFLEAARVLVAAGQFRHEIFECLEHRAILQSPPILAYKRANSEPRVAYRNKRKAIAGSSYSLIATGYSPTSAARPCACARPSRAAPDCSEYMDF